MSAIIKHKNFLVALIKSFADFKIAYEKNWYRIPCYTKRVPKSVKNGTLKYIAFYQPKIFNKEAYCIRWYAEVTKISIVKRKILFPMLANDPKAEDDYYKIEFKKLQELSTPIISYRHRRILFIHTTLWHFKNAKNINDLFFESPIEEKLWQSFKTEEIFAERQFEIKFKEKMFYLDFAIFCKQRNIDIECDGDRYHLSEESVKKDKKRNNILESKGWSVLRFTSDDIIHNNDSTINYIKEAINNNGGMLLNDINTIRYFPDDNVQPGLFDT